MKWKILKRQQLNQMILVGQTKKNCKQKRIGYDVDNVVQQEFYKIYCKAFIMRIDAHARLHADTHKKWSICFALFC